MTFRDACKEFELDCKVRHLSPKTIDNYTKQLRYLENHLSSEFSVLNIEDVKPAHIKSFMAKMDDAGRKPQLGRLLIRPNRAVKLSYSVFSSA